ncbi:MAG: hypothetical protein F4Z58_12365 [Acidimicrobiaceae bacterium]|nr:DUF6159 family protein [Acidimicrobiaceae bacterium]MXW61492.1 hypothetical protein [Acidimicrobiaceae bacterium]MXW76805.1 hypothetical protein [Acidimicrobiaceae bacterium]MYC41843.1 hypothetical protein [Acidimicrobiaceae bacterium]MYD07721.1 hypothetical protein [Acidimicrobiaceae bacterium]
MGRISNTFQLAKLSWGVLKKDRELLALPVLSFLVSAALLIPLVFVAFATASTGSAAGEETTASPAMALVGIVGALGLSVISVFFNGALVAGAHERLTGGDPTVGSAIRKAFSRISGLVPWAILTATVGMILRALRDRAGGLSNFVLGIIGMAWEVATFLVVPAIVIDDKGAWDGLKKSGALLKSTWGENLAARVGFGLLGFVAILPVILVVAVLGSLGGAGLILGIIIGVAWVGLVVVVMTALNAVFQAALYLYATSGMAPSGFEGSTLGESFSRR